jgi:hypothetical protein
VSERDALSRTGSRQGRLSRSWSELTRAMACIFINIFSISDNSDNHGAPQGGGSARVRILVGRTESDGLAAGQVVEVLERADEGDGLHLVRRRQHVVLPGGGVREGQQVQLAQKQPRLPGECSQFTRFVHSVLRDLCTRCGGGVITGRANRTATTIIVIIRTDIIMSSPPPSS